MSEESNITMPPEEMKKWNGMNGGKLDLERARLQEMLQWSCWIINNERISLLWAYGKHLKMMRWQPATNKKQLLAWDQRRDENFFRREDRRKLESLINTTIATFLREGFRWNMTQDNSNKEIDGFKIPQSWQLESPREIVKSDIRPPQKIR